MRQFIQFSIISISNPFWIAAIFFGSRVFSPVCRSLLLDRWAFLRPSFIHKLPKDQENQKISSKNNADKTEVQMKSLTNQTVGTLLLLHSYNFTRNMYVAKSFLNSRLIIINLILKTLRFQETFTKSLDGAALWSIPFWIP